MSPQHLRNFMCVHWECPWCYCQMLDLAPPYPTLHKYTYSTLESSCVYTDNVHGASAKYWSQHQRIPNCTNIRPQFLRKIMGVHWECAWCYCQTLELAPPYPTLHKYNYSTLESLYVSTGNVRGASTKYWSQHHRIPHYTNTPTILQ